MIGDANRILGEGSVVVAIGIGGRWAEALEVVFRDGVGVGAQRSERESTFLRLEGEGIDLDGIEDIFAALLAGEEIVDPGDENVAAKLEGMAAGIEAEGF